MTTEELSPAGHLLEAARGSMSKREAARRAGISEGRWRQIVTGVQRMGKGNVIPTTSKPETLTAMARAVRADLHAVLTAAGFEAPTEDLSAPVGAGVDPELLAEMADLNPVRVQRVKDFIRGIKASD